MPSANVLAGSTRLKHSVKAIKDQWLNVEPTWTDAVRRRFEERYLLPIEPATDAALNGILKLADVLDRLRRDLSDRSDLA